MRERKPIDPNSAVDFMVAAAPVFAKARAERIYLEEFRKSKKAMLMQRHLAERPGLPIAAQEREAYADPEYLQVLEGLRAAAEAEETARWRLIAAQARVEVWRSQEASNRNLDGAAR